MKLLKGFYTTKGPLKALWLPEKHFGSVIARKEQGLWKQANLGSDPITLLPRYVDLSGSLNLSKPQSSSV